MLHRVRRGKHGHEPLLLIMGLSGTHLMWGEPFLGLLEKDFDVVAYDHRGVGLSPRVEAPFSLKELADDAVALMDDLGWEAAHVMGISMGGMIAQELAVHHGGRIKTLTLGCTYPGGRVSTMTPQEVLAELGPAIASGDAERAIRATFKANVSRAYAEDPEHFETFFEMATSVKVKVKTILLQMQAIGDFDLSEKIASIDKPTLVIQGTEDQMIPFANAKVLGDRIPGAKVEILEGVGHLFFWEQPEKSAALVKRHALGKG